jgi:hypothetical protein
VARDKSKCNVKRIGKESAQRPDKKITENRKKKIKTYQTILGSNLTKKK